MATVWCRCTLWVQLEVQSSLCVQAQLLSAVATPADWLHSTPEHAAELGAADWQLTQELVCLISYTASSLHCANKWGLLSLMRLLQPDRGRVLLARQNGSGIRTQPRVSKSELKATGPQRRLLLSCQLRLSSYTSVVPAASLGMAQGTPQGSPSTLVYSGRSRLGVTVHCLPSYTKQGLPPT